jgi:hypothetical protein
MARFNSFTSPGTGVSSLITPVLNFSTAGTKRITFWMYRDDGYASDADRIEIYTNTSANLTGATLLGTINRSRNLAPTGLTANGWYEYFYDVTTTSATTYVIFKAVGAYGNNMFLDDIKVEAPPAPCSGTPTPGNTIASVNPVGSGSSTVLSLQNATTGSGVTYQWQSSPNNSTWTNVASGGTSATYTATPTSATYYRCNVTCSGSTGASNSLLVNLTYCTPTSSSSSTYFSGFTTSGGSTNISNNSTAFSSGGYVNYSSSMAVSQFATGTVNFSATIVGGTAGIAIFVDYNNDFDFTDVGETVYNSAAYQSNGTTNSSFVIPSGTALGNYRMRIITDYNASSPTSCSFASGSRGEIEDYTLTVVAQPSCLAPSVSATNTIATTSATINWSA